MDRLHFTLEMPITSTENVYAVQMFLLFDVKLHVSALSKFKLSKLNVRIS